MSRKQKGTKKSVQRRSRVNQGRLTHSDLLHRALAWVIDEKIFSELSLHGNTGWTAGQLVVLRVWSSNSTLTGAFQEAFHLSTVIGQAAVATYEGLMDALVKWTPQLVPLLWARLQILMQDAGGTYWRVGPWLALAVDGSRVTTPRTKSNEEAFSAKNYGQGHTAKSRKKRKNKRKRSKKLSTPVKPQIWLTLIWHMGLKMPWCWKSGPSTSSERQHFLELLKAHKFPMKTLFCCDAGFVGYELWKTIIDQGHSFLIRVGGNVRLLRGLGRVRCRDGLVYLWPNAVARNGQPPLILRLLEFQGPRGRVYLVTNVLSVEELTLPQAKQLYKLRWGIELQFRTFKQTFGRANLLSRTAPRALVELEWSLIGLWVVQLFGAKEQIKIGSPPQNSSAALALAVIRDTMRMWNSETMSQRELTLRLREAVKDQYQRTSCKEARYKPNFKDKPCATMPIILEASAKQKRAYKALGLAV